VDFLALAEKNPQLLLVGKPPTVTLLLLQSIADYTYNEFYFTKNKNATTTYYCVCI